MRKPPDAVAWKRSVTDPAAVRIPEARARLDRLAQARRDLRPGGQPLPAYYQRVAQLWSAEARIWANLRMAPDFPLGTPSGALLARAASMAAQYADARAVSWWTSSGAAANGEQASL